MIQVLLVVHLVITVAMIGLILLQRSEGGGLGIGGGSGGMGGFASPRATANALSKATMTCFALFVALSLILAILSGGKGKQTSLIDQMGTAVPAVQTVPASPEPAIDSSKSVDQPIPPVVPMAK